MARLFVGTLKEVAFEWFMKLPADSIKSWADFEKLFLTCFFEDDKEVAMPTLLATKQKKWESIKAFVERLWSMALCCPSALPNPHWWKHATSTYNCTSHPDGVTECRTWKRLVQQGEQEEEIVARVRAEEKDSKPKLDKSTQPNPK